MTPSVTLVIDVMAGTPIELAAEEALHIANTLRCWVEFDFNDVTCKVAPHSKPKDLVAEYQVALTDKGPVKHPRRAYARSVLTQEAPRE